MGSVLQSTADDFEFSVFPCISGKKKDFRSQAPATAHSLSDPIQHVQKKFRHAGSHHTLGDSQRPPGGA